MKSLLTLSFILFGLLSYAQMSPPTTLTEQQEQELEIYKKKWWLKEWPKVSRKHDVYFNCETCNAVELDLRVVVNDKGGVDVVELIDNNVRCLQGMERESLMQHIMQTVRHWKLGENFYNVTFEFNLGVAIKC